MGGHRRCEICGIREYHQKTKIIFSPFPSELSRCRAWLKAVGNEELVHLPVEKLNQNRNVCAKHFRKEDFNRKGNRLKKGVIPTVNLSALPLTDSQLAEFPQHVFSYYKKLTESSLSSAENKENVEQADVLPESAPSTSQQSKSVLMETSQMDVLSEPMPSTSQQKRSILMETHQSEKVHTKKYSRTLSKRSAGTDKHLQEDKINLSPREKTLMEQLKKTKCTLASLRRSMNTVEKLDSNVLREIVNSALQNQKRKPKGRRWTTKNKISALAIFKRSPKAYRYLQHLMPLPSIKTLQNVLKKIPMTTGISKAVLQHLKNISTKINSKDKFCSLVFDEIALKRRLLYDVSSDKVEGYEDFGIEMERNAQLADHALMFMLQGVRAKFKQPIAFYFVKGTVSAQKLASFIKEIIIAVEETGYTVLSTICDQGPTNMGALKLLRTLSTPSDQNENYFHCRDKKVYIIYDVPHLFKSIRNNFQKYGILSMDGIQAKWEHLLKVEEKNRNLLYLSKITPMHVQPKYRAKMKVKLAAQILSNTVAAVVKLLAEVETCPQLSQEMMQTGKIIHDLDRLFDKTNGPSCPDDVKKGIRENVSTKTDHVRVWTEYREKLKKIVFRNSNGTKAKNVRCIEGYLTTLKSLNDIWSKVSSVGFKYLNLRHLNQDALENLFGVIRQHSPTNRNPTCYSFISALKTSVISGLTAPHNRGFNCEKDNKNLLTDFHNIVFDKIDINNENLSFTKNRDLSDQIELDDSLAESSSLDIPVLSIPEELESIETDLAQMEKQPIVYVSGYIASSILKKQKCLNCEKCLRNDEPDDDPVYSYIKLREWWPDVKSLYYPTKNLCRLVETATKIFEIEILPCLHYRNISQLTITMFIAKCDMSFFNCEQHGLKIKNIIYSKLALLLIRRQCNRINESISVDEENIADINKRAQQAGVAK